VKEVTTFHATRPRDRRASDAMVRARWKGSWKLVDAVVMNPIFFVRAASAAVSDSGSNGSRGLWWRTGSKPRKSA